jgi:hypothetical protein
VEESYCIELAKKCCSSLRRDFASTKNGLIFFLINSKPSIFKNVGQPLQTLIKNAHHCWFNLVWLG